MARCDVGAAANGRGAQAVAVGAHATEPRRADRRDRRRCDRLRRRRGADLRPAGGRGLARPRAATGAAGDRRTRRAGAARGRERRGDRPRHARRSAPTTTRNGWSAASAPGCRPSSTTTSLSWSMAPIRSSTSSSARPAIPPVADLRAQLAPSLDLLRGRLAAIPSRTVAVLAQNPRKPGRRTALIQQFAGRPAIVAAVAVGTEADLALGNDRAPIVFSVKYIDDEHVARDQQPAAAAGPAQDRRSGPGRRAARRELADPQGGRHRALRLDADPAGRRDRGQRTALHRRRARRLRAAGRPGDALHAADRRKRSWPARRNCATSPCTIRCAACPTASTSANGSRASSPRCGAASRRRPCSTSTSITSRTSTTRSATTSATSSSSTSPSG